MSIIILDSKTYKVKVTYSNGNIVRTWINGTKEEIRDYYFNNTFYDKMAQVIKVEFIR